MNQINAIFSQIGLFFKDTFLTIPNFFNWKYLTSAPAQSFKYPIPTLTILLVCIALGFLTQFLTERKTAPKFYKKFLGSVANFLIYPPVILIFLVFAKIGGVAGVENTIWVAITLALWLIYFLYLIYYRLVVVAKLWRKYQEVKREEKYFKNGNSKRRN